MAALRRMTLGLVLGLAWSVSGLAALPAGAQATTGCFAQPPLPDGGQIACGEPGISPPVIDVPLLPTPVVGVPDLPALEGPQDICDFYGFCGAAEPAAP